MANIATLSVNLIAKTATFEKGMRKGRVATSKFKATAMALKSAMATLMGVFVAIQSARVITNYISNTMQAIDVTAKLSRRLGIATEDLIALQHAAQITGVSQEALNKSLDMFTRRMGEMSTGTGEALRGFQLLSMEYEEFIGLDPMAAFKKIADRISTMGDKTKKAAAAYFMFGRAGAQLVNLLEQGSAGIEEFERVVEKLGLTFDKFDAAKVEAANDAILRMKQSVRALGQELTITLAPAIRTVADELTHVIAQSDRWFEKPIKDPKSFLAFASQFTSRILRLLGKGDLITKTKTARGGGLAGLEDAMDNLVKSTEKAEKVTLKWKSSYLAAADAVTELVKTPLERFTDRMEFLDKTVDRGLITWETYTRAVELAKKELDEINKMKLEDALDELEKSKVKIDRPFEAGMAREISNLISVPGLTATNDPIVGKMDIQIALQEKTNELLRLIENKTEAVA